VFKDASIMHLHDSVAAVGEIAIVRGHEQSDAFNCGKLQEKIEDHAARLFVERTGRLIGKQDLWLIYECAAERSSLALPARELLDPVIEAVTDTGALGQVKKALLCNLAINPGRNCREQAILGKRQTRDQIVKLKHETNLIPQQVHKIATPVDLDTVDGN
jgi:hypothetical protein